MNHLWVAQLPVIFPSAGPHCDPPQTRNQQKDAQNSLAAGRLGGVMVVTPVISIDIISMNSWFCQRFGWNDDLQLANNVGTV